MTKDGHQHVEPLLTLRVWPARAVTANHCLVSSVNIRSWYCTLMSGRFQGSGSTKS